MTAPNGMTVEVDAGIVDLVQYLWDLGWVTVMCCEDSSNLGWAWIRFSTEEQAQQFAGRVGHTQAAEGRRPRRDVPGQAAPVALLGPGPLRRDEPVDVMSISGSPPSARSRYQRRTTMRDARHRTSPTMNGPASSTATNPGPSRSATRWPGWSSNSCLPRRPRSNYGPRGPRWMRFTSAAPSCGNATERFAAIDGWSSSPPTRSPNREVAS